MALANGQAFTSGILATDATNAQDAASDALGAFQESTWQSSMMPVGNPGDVPTTIWTGGEGIFGSQTPIISLHVAVPADGGGMTAATASLAPATFAPAPADL